MGYAPILRLAEPFTTIKKMKIHQLRLILIFIIFVIGCGINTKEENIKVSESSDLNASVEKPIDLIKKGYTIQSKANYLSGKLLVAKKGKLKGYKSLNIKGHQFYEFDKRGNIKATYYGISNNYSIYTYDKKNRLVKSENKQHTPPEVFNDMEYKYSKTDSVIEITTTSYKNNEPINTKLENKDISLSEKDVKKVHFENNRNSDIYMNSEKDKIVAYEDEMLFCCGVEMKGKNKLIYHMNENELIDSLIIVGMENGKRMKFEYQYE